VTADCRRNGGGVTTLVGETAAPRGCRARPCVSSTDRWPDVDDVPQVDGVRSRSPGSACLQLW
jgi:hypothetical protein